MAIKCANLYAKGELLGFLEFVTFREHALFHGIFPVKMEFSSLQQFLVKEKWGK